MKLTLPFPPSLNNMYPTSRSGVRYTSERGKKFKNDVAEQMLKERPTMLDGEIAVKLSLYRPRKTGDIDNFCKPVLDSLKGYCFNDDKQIVELHVRRFDDKNNPRVEVEIERLSSDAEGR